MRIPVYVLGVGLIFSVAIANAQSQQQQTPPISPSTPANHVGDGAQTKAGTPAPQSTGAPATTGGVAGAASSSTAPSPDTANSGGTISAMSDSDLQSQIQNALSKEPTLSGDSAHANVSGDTIELAGTVGTNKEKITATRIVQSYAGSKKLVNKLTVNGRSEKPSEKGTPAPESKPPQR